MPLHPYFDLPRPAILGHRGAAGDAPENTLRAFGLGLERGAHILESDIHATRDGIPVAIHDAFVDRVTNGTGRVADLTLEELHLLDAGCRFRAQSDGADAPGPFEGQGIVVPTLESAFAAYPDARFNLEIKDSAAGVVDAVADLVERHDRAERTLLTAGDQQTMERLRARVADRGPQVALGACTADVIAFVQAALEDAAPPPGVMALQIPTEFAGQPLITPALIAYAHAYDIQVHAWTINDPAEIHRLVALGVDGIVTDYPGRMAALSPESPQAGA